MHSFIVCFTQTECPFFFLNRTFGDILKVNLASLKCHLNSGDKIDLIFFPPSTTTNS